MEEVSRRDVGKRDLEAVSGDEGLVEAAHDVDLRPLRQLLFAPDHGVVEQRVRRAAERAFQTRRTAFVDDVELSVGQQRHAVRLGVVNSRRTRCCKYRRRKGVNDSECDQ